MFQLESFPRVPGLRRFGTWTIVAAVPLFLSAISSALQDAQVQSGMAPSADPHADLLAGVGDDESRFPSAKTCAACHANIYEEWRTSQHAYAAISPMFHKFEQTINELASGTVGSFCVRCHISVGTSLGEPRETPVYQRNKVSIEGVTCVTCHRVNESFGKTNGSRRLEEGPITAPVAGIDDLSDFDQTVAANNVTNSANDAKGRDQVHQKPFKMAQLEKSEFCVSCHQVAVYPGIKLEVVWDQYRDSPAMKAGVTCQDCHMAKTPGTAKDGYGTAPRAVVNGNAIHPGSKHTDHSFIGPGYAIAHPGIFPHNLHNPKDFTVDRWMQFDWRAGWGADEFEQNVAAGKVSEKFPDAWKDANDRRTARKLVDENREALAKRNEKRRYLMEHASRIDGPFFDSSLGSGEDLKFHYDVNNIADGHNFPSGSLGAQPEIWLDVALIAPDGKNIWESGFTDSHGDMADLHSKDVLAGVIPHDADLFNLQTKFLTTNLKGTDREMYLPVPFDGDQLPYIRPAGVPNTVINHPPFIRMEQRSLPPLSSRTAKYTVPSNLMNQKGVYKLAVRLRSRAEPMYFMEFCGATNEMLREINAQMIDIHPSAVEFDVR